MPYHCFDIQKYSSHQVIPQRRNGAAKMAGESKTVTYVIRLPKVHKKKRKAEDEGHDGKLVLVC